MRRLVVAAALLPGLAGCGHDPDPVELLPDLVQTRPAAISVAEANGGYRLVFLSAVENAGEGAMIVEGRRTTTAERSMTATQIVSRADGSTRSYPLGADLRYVASETHAHWHLLDFEHYELHRMGDGRLVARDRKTGFCLGDRYDASPGAARNEPAHAVWTKECGLHRPGLLRVHEGISPGYGDDYVPTLEGQFLPLGGLPAGRYRLWHRVNPEGILRESNYSNNGSYVVLELSWRRGVPTIAVLG